MADGLTGLGGGLLLFGLLASAVNLRRAFHDAIPHWFLGSVWSPLLPVGLGAAALAYDAARALAATLP